MKHKVPVQSLIDHIKTVTDVDPWAKEMAEELLEKQKAVKPRILTNEHGFQYCYCGVCCHLLPAGKPKFCNECGQKVKWI